jgi:hypothetical protein
MSTYHLSKAALVVCHLYNNPSSDTILSQMKLNVLVLLQHTTSTATDNTLAVNGLTWIFPFLQKVLSTGKRLWSGKYLKHSHVTDLHFWNCSLTAASNCNACTQWRYVTVHQNNFYPQRSSSRLWKKYINNVLSDVCIFSSFCTETNIPEKWMNMFLRKPELWYTLPIKKVSIFFYCHDCIMDINGQTSLSP